VSKKIDLGDLWDSADFCDSQDIIYINAHVALALIRAVGKAQALTRAEGFGETPAESALKKSLDVFTDFCE
jgi:hypothetical protein